jgi:hypothetical protein
VFHKSSANSLVSIVLYIQEKKEENLNSQQREYRSKSSVKRLAQNTNCIKERKIE